jgi:environmental stress-induced protein Ves
MARNAKNQPGWQIRKFATYRSMPWRNGQGSTLEIAREPAAGEDFAWRLSLADIDRDGEFSVYPGYRRTLVLVAGNLLRLKFRGHGRCLLHPGRRGVRFEGEWRTHCAIPQGRCTDLSLIVRRGSGLQPTSLVRAPRILRIKASTRLVLAGALYAALFVLEGAVAVAASTRARPCTLRVRDTLLLPAGRRRTLRLQSRAPSAARLVLLRWRPGRVMDE